MALECARAERRGDTGTPRTVDTSCRPVSAPSAPGSAATTCLCHRLLLCHLYNYAPCGPRVSPRDCTGIKAGDNRYHNCVNLHDSTREPRTPEHTCVVLSAIAPLPRRCARLISYLNFEYPCSYTHGRNLSQFCIRIGQGLVSVPARARPHRGRTPESGPPAPTHRPPERDTVH